MLRKAALSLCAIVALSGCANANSIWRNESMLRSKDGISITSMDARQRTLIASRNAHPTDGNPLQYCAEQAPDVFAVLASSFRADGALSVSPEAREAKAAIASAMSETASTIARTQSLNLITQLLYRTCEAGLNGRLSGDQMEQALRRNQRLVMAMMAIEQLTTLGQKPRPIIISGGLASITGDVEAAKRLQAAFEQRATARAGFDAADKSFNEALAKAPDVAPPAKQTCASIENGDDKLKCTTAETNRTNAERVQKEAGELYDALRAAGGAGLNAGQDLVAASQGSDSVLDVRIVQTIAEATIELAKLTTITDEYNDICRWINNSGANASLSVNDDQIRRECRERRAENEPKRLEVGALTFSQRAATSSTAQEKPTPAAERAAVTGRIFIQIAKPQQGTILTQLPRALREKFPNGRISEALDLEINSSPNISEVRYFREADALAAQLLVEEIKRLPYAPQNIVINNLSAYGRSRNISPGLLEVWIGGDFGPS